MRFVRATMIATLLVGCKPAIEYPWVDPAATPRRVDAALPFAYFADIPNPPPVRMFERDVITNPPPPIREFDVPMVPVVSPTVLPLPALLAVEPEPPPAISGGNVYATTNGQYVVMSDADRDRLWIVNTEPFTLRHEVRLMPGDEPGRITEDARGIVYVALRRSGNVVSIDPERGTILARRPACSGPRGIAFDAVDATIKLVCIGGELVSLPVDGSPSTTTMLEPDLRDIVVRANDIVVSTFRTARVLFYNRLLRRVGEILHERLRATITIGGRPGPQVDFTINTSWRMVGRADGSLLMTAQASSQMPLFGGIGYTGLPGDIGCVGMVNTALFRVTSPGSPPELMHLSRLLPLPVDVVDDGVRPWIVSAANRGDRLPTPNDGFAQAANIGLESCTPSRANLPEGVTITGGAVVRGTMVFFSRQPAGLLRTNGQRLWFDGAANVEHTGHRVFHTNFNSAAGLTCASCHPDGSDDGLTWNVRTGPFRTPSLRGTIRDTAPYHWNGEFIGLTNLATAVFTQRMGGPVLTAPHVDQLQTWLDALPAFVSPTPSDATRASIDRGAVIFRTAPAGCNGCHSGPRFTNNQSENVGTGGPFQVPSLIGLRFRAPYMHNGCAASIDARLSSMACGGAMHGGFGLTDAQKADLAAYLLSI